MEFIEAIVIGLAVFRFLLWPLTKHFCIQWMDCPPEPGHRGIEDMNPISSTARAGRPGGF